ncbi:MAG: right-handed parallel beta-helix repeat-containing protein [Candidatus Hydrogenedentes bacterium]|nr:right-handed parallel beta-helix repeat-containing protein [Candidatus Hydrogenedentota bacterium]
MASLKEVTLWDSVSVSIELIVWDGYNFSYLFNFLYYISADSEKTLAWGEITMTHQTIKLFLKAGVMLLILTPALLAEPVNIYVSPKGDDNWSGEIEEPNSEKTNGPFATINRALDKVKEIRKNFSEDSQSTVKIIIREGIYNIITPLVIEPEHSGTEKAPTIIENYPEEKPVISGGIEIKEWKREGEFLTASVPEINGKKVRFYSLWVNRVRRQPARTPNPKHPFGDYPSKEDFFTAAKFEYTPKTAEKPAQLWLYYAEKDKIDALGNFKYSYCVPFCSWIAPLLLIKAIDTENARFELAVPDNFWLGPVYTNNRPFYIEHIFSGLDSPGEWFLDYDASKIYYYPYPNETPENIEVIVPVVEQLLILKGNPVNESFVKHVEIRGITFEFTDFDLAKGNGQADAQAEVSVPATVQTYGAKNCLVEKCTIQHVNNYGIWLREGSQYNTIRQCHLYDLGAGGIKIGETHSAETKDVSDQTTPDSNLLYLYDKLTNTHVGYNTVENCYIHEGGLFLRAGIGVWIGRSSYNRVSNNEISDFRYTGVSVGWCWGYDPSSAHHNIIENNHIHNIGKAQLSDMGGIYTLGVSPGTILRNNHIHDIMCREYGGWGLYTDEGSSYILLENNIVHHTHTGGFHQHYGRENRVENNIFAFSANEQIIRSREENHISFIFIRNIVYFDNGLLLGGNWTNKMWKMDNNCYWDTSLKELNFKGKNLKEWRELGFDQNSIIEDPKFVNAENADFRLKEDSPVAKIDFKPINLSDIGLTGDADWKNLPKNYTRVPCPLSAK